MNRTAAAFLLAVLGLGPPAAAQAPAPDAAPKTPSAIAGVLYSRTFTLEKGYAFEWRKERPTVGEGTILVLEAPAAWLRPRQVAEPVLYVGGSTAERVNRGDGSGRLVVVVPGKVDLSKDL